MRPLDVESLMDAARRRTGLTNFGDTTFYEPLGRLLDSCKNEARLNSIGRLVCSEDILQLLCNRLEIQRDLENWPDIATQPIPASVFITGLPRSGTTLLHNLFAQAHREFHAPATWEVMFPSPPPFAGRENYPRIKRAETNLAWFKPVSARVSQDSSDFCAFSTRMRRHSQPFLHERPIRYHVQHSDVSILARETRYAACLCLCLPPAGSAASAVWRTGTAVCA